VSARYGPYRIVAFHCGKFEYAEVEIDVPAHLIGPNNVGKTSLIALLQFLYLDDQRHMKFSRDMAETRKYYFPETCSYALFECLTPTGFQVVGVHGLGPVKQYEFERFKYTGRIELEDYLDEDRRMREADEVKARLATRNYHRLEPRHLKAALTGLGEARGEGLGLVPARHGSSYERFRKVFGNILRLAHIRQEELKQLLLDIYSHDFQQREIDLGKMYAVQYEQVRRNALELRELKLLQGDIERLLQHMERRDRARGHVPALWQAVGRVYKAQQAEVDRQEMERHQRRDAVVRESGEVNTRLEQVRAGGHELARERGLLEQKLNRVAELRRRFHAFVPDWSRQRLAHVKAQRDALVVKLGQVAYEPVEQVQRRLGSAEAGLAAKRRQMENLAHALVNLLRAELGDEDIAAAFAVLNPDWLSVPANCGKPGVTTADSGSASSLIRRLLAGRAGETLELEGVRLDLSAVAAPRLADYLDAGRMNEELERLERDVQRYRETLETARHVEAMRAEEQALDQESSAISRELGAYEEFCAEQQHEAEWQAGLAVATREEQALRQQGEQLEARLAGLREEDQRIRSACAELERRRAALRALTEKLAAPPEDWPLQPLEGLTEDLEDLVARYRRTCGEQQSQAEQVQELLDTIDSRTYGRYTGGDEAATIRALREQLEGIAGKEKALEDMWKSIAVGIKKDLQNIGKDLETFKGLVSGLNRQMSAVNISNLASLKLLIEARPVWVKRLREITIDNELPLFSDTRAADEAFEGIGRLLSEHPNVKLQDMFDLCFEIGMPDGRIRRHEHLDAIESNGTTVAIKVLVNLILLRGVLGRDDVQVPFYLDECSSLDQGNLAAIVGLARQMGFIAVLASPEAMDAAEKLYFIEEQPGGRVMLDPRTALVHVQRGDVPQEVEIHA